jgi:RHS repeat-associated protein
MTLVSNSYDAGYPAYIEDLREHDTANYGGGFTYRGNVTQRVAGGVTTNFSYDITGTVTDADDGQGHSVSIDPAEGTNHAAPGVITPNSQSNLAESLTYSSFLAVTTDTGPNASTATTAYDYSGRPTSSTSPYGATTTYTYTNSPPTTTATTNGRWTKTTMDGLGRTIKVETGYGSTTVSTADTEYDSCACSPLGKVKRVSQPYAPGGTVYWTTYSYDCLGRTVSVAQPGSSGTATYVYQGNTVTLTDSAGKWKKYTLDALGSLVQVTEPNPGGGEVQTYYTYNLRNQLTGVSMPRGGTTQTRTFNYDLTTGRLSSAANPENGTVSYAYNTDGSLASKTDAKNQQVQYTYDSYRRVTQIRRYPVAGGNEDPCQRTDLYYDTNPLDGSYTQNGWGRPVAAAWGGQSCTGGEFKEMYSYTAAGLATKKKLVRNAGSLEAGYTYDNEGKMVSVAYPNSGPTFTYTYDSMGRPIKLTDNQAEPVDWAKDVVYNAAGQMTQVKQFNPSSGGWRTETRQYNVLQQMTRLTVASSSTLLDYEYRFSDTQNNGRITQRKEWVSGEEVSYQYDALNRLISAATTGPEWGQSFGYDGFGNLLSQTVTKGSAPTLSVNVNPATNRITTGGYGYDANGNLTSMPMLTMSYNVENRLVQATDTTNGTDQYGYDPAGRRVWKHQGDFDYVSFYSVDGTVLGTYLDTGAGFGYGEGGLNVYFAGKLVAMRMYSWAGGVAAHEDRLGSVARRGSTNRKYFPYGEEPTTTAQNETKFGTYYRDQTTALDYAQNRYYARTIGRFTTTDPYPGNLGSPQSLNRYTYVGNDPVNRNDPSGLDYTIPDPDDYDPSDPRNVPPESVEVVATAFPVIYYIFDLESYQWAYLDSMSEFGMRFRTVGAGGRGPGGGSKPQTARDLMLSRRALAHNAIYYTGDKVFGPEILDCLAGRESGWNATADNGQGFRGMFQMGAAAWASVYRDVPDAPTYLPNVFDQQTSAAAAAVYLNLRLEWNIGMQRYESGDYTDGDLKAAIRAYNGSAIAATYADQIWDCAQKLKAHDLEGALSAIGQ